MIANEVLSKLIQQALSAIPSATHEVKQQLHQSLLNGLQKLDIVTRDEFEIQSALLQRSREKLTQMEQKIAELERQVIGKS